MLSRGLPLPDACISQWRCPLLNGCDCCCCCALPAAQVWNAITYGAMHRADAAAALQAQAAAQSARAGLQTERFDVRTEGVFKYLQVMILLLLFFTELLASSLYQNHPCHHHLLSYHPPPILRAGVHCLCKLLRAWRQRCGQCGGAVLCGLLGLALHRHAR